MSKCQCFHRHIFTINTHFYKYISIQGCHNCREPGVCREFETKPGKKLSLKTAGNLKISTKIQIFEKCLSKYFKTCSVSFAFAWVSQAAGYHVTSHLGCPSGARLIDISASHGLHFSNPALTHHEHRGESVDACRVCCCHCQVVTTRSASRGVTTSSFLNSNLPSRS